MRNDEPRPIGRVRYEVRAAVDTITREGLPERIRELLEKLQRVEPVESPVMDEKSTQGRKEQL
jgi:hypothetical protein